MLGGIDAGKIPKGSAEVGEEAKTSAVKAERLHEP
jgi:hypothetical protein